MSGIAEKLIEKGREEGAEQVNALYKELIDSGKVEDMYKAMNDTEYRKELLKERFTSRSCA